MNAIAALFLLGGAAGGCGEAASSPPVVAEAIQAVLDFDAEPAEAPGAPEFRLAAAPDSDRDHDAPEPARCGRSTLIFA